ncbi:hypothetical protein [Actinoplanes sp. NBRC 103695]|uniref:hypothetical protein n=1 Tax=Actinoplanes sp. NBRC 103695 TaxID=3032202 RepID=UPI00255682CD|nr:hypothetical protein [Actinoplanes sp. NBRC 103695]
MLIVSAVVFAAAAPALATVGGRADHGNRATPSQAVVAGTTPVSVPESTYDALIRLADTIIAAPADSATGYAYHRQRRWILDTTGTPAPTGMRENTPAVFALDIRRWEAADGSGLGIDVENPPDYRLKGANPNYRTTDDEFAHGHVKRTNYSAGNARSPISGPISTEPAALARQLAVADPMPDGPQATVRAVDELYRSHYVNLPARQAVLRVLADLGGLTYRIGATDRLGRAGVAVSLASRGVQYTLLFDPTDGRLLASEQRSTGAHEYLPVPHGLVRYYTLFIEQARRPGLD